ncbi:MAG TPA: hypothetical protein VNY73_00190, partial [Bacteroidia bacterium]|nr:hypothetical protein [Bacteroidia bacterium]
MQLLKNNIVNLAIAIVFFFSAWLAGNLGAYDQQNIKDDIIWYHAYAPALFLKKDLKLDFYRDSTSYYADRGMYWAVSQENGNPVIKGTCGQEIMYLPFTCWVFMYYAGENVTGYEIPFSSAICISSLVYFLLSLILLKKILEHFSFSKKSIALTVIFIGMGTNLISFTTACLGTAHTNDFFLATCLMYLLIKWFDAPKIKYSILIGISFGLLVLIRPTNILYGFLILLYGVTGGNSFKNHGKFLLAQAKHLAIMAVFVFLIFLPQLFYWKYATGYWIYYSYVDERFFFSSPHVIDYIFGFRKGWLIYSPLLILALAGLFLGTGKKNVFFMPAVTIISL